MDAPAHKDTWIVPGTDPDDPWGRFIIVDHGYVSKMTDIAYHRGLHDGLMKVDPPKVDRPRTVPGAWLNRRDSSMPFQRWKVFTPETIVEVKNAFGDRLIGPVSSFDWDYESGNPDSNITSVRLYVVKMDTTP